MTTTPVSDVDARRLADLTTYLETQVDTGRLPGIALRVVRGDRVLLDVTRGFADLEEQVPVAPDTVFALYSLTKPLAAIAMLLLHEEGAWQLDDRIDQHLPEFAGLLELPGNGATRLPVLRETFTHTAGLSLGDTPDERLRRFLHVNWMTAGSLDEYVERLATLPLAHEPGSRFAYSFACDLHAAMVERITGQRFDRFLQERVLGPLGMVDTTFDLTDEQRARLARGYVLDATSGALRPALPEERLESSFALGGTSLFSTVSDYLRLGRMLLSGGELDGVRVLQPSSVALMFGNHLSPDLMAVETPLLHYRVGGGNGFGLNGMVCVDPVAAGRPVGRGTYEWGGAFGTFFWVDPENDITCVGMTNRARTDEQRPVEVVAQEIVYDALRVGTQQSPGSAS